MIEMMKRLGMQPDGRETSVRDDIKNIQKEIGYVHDIGLNLFIYLSIYLSIYLHSAESSFKSQYLLGYSRNPQHFMETESSLTS
jgi:hypothetical protein